MTKICLIAGNSHEAYQWARNQNLSREQWFYPSNVNDLLFKTNFHVLVIGTAGQNIPADIFEMIYQTALKAGSIGRN